ncbi:MAG: hypothetical protein ACREQ9_20365 [Candidatus Binatia bacterium]
MKFGLMFAFVAHAGPDPAAIADLGTIELLTVGAEEGEHWSTVWFVVIDGTIYVRLGPRAATRIEKNATAPRLEIRVSGKDVHPMRYEKAPETAEQIAAAMAQKYWTDFLGEPFRRLGLTAPPLILRLTPEPEATVGPIPRV